jgi:signal transduction histidine kinase
VADLQRPQRPGRLRLPVRRLRLWLRLRLKPRTVRGRATAAVTLVAAVALAACAGVLLFAVHSNLVGTARTAALQRVSTAAGDLRAGTAPSAVGAGTDGSVSVTKAAPAGRLPTDPVPTTGQATGPAPVPVTGAVLPVGNGTITLSVPTAEGTYVLSTVPDLSSARAAVGTMIRLLLFSVPLVLLLVAAITWLAMGRALRPVEAIRAEFAEITSHDLHRRVPDPGAGDEVSRLAGTMNLTLDQLQRAVVRLRTFTSDASHELRSPLTTLRTRLELAVAAPERADWPDTGRESLRDAEQLQVIVEDLLLLARLDAGQVPGGERIEPGELVRQVAGERSGTRQLVLLDAAEPAVVLGSRVALSRLLANLVDNAVRHARTTVGVEVRNERDQVVVEVTDDGPGIPPDDRERVFDRFTRLDDARTRDSNGHGHGSPDGTGSPGGTGLGLAIARDIATAHGGTVSAEPPAPGHGGARLVLTLPAGPLLTCGCGGSSVRTECELNGS